MKNFNFCPGCDCNRCRPVKPMCPPCLEKDIISAGPACCRPCWDTCKCMDEILNLKSGLTELQSGLDTLNGRVLRDENTIKDNYDSLSRLIGNLAEKEASDIANEQNRATGEEQRILSILNTYIDSNDNTVDAISDGLAAEIARAKAAEQLLDTNKANAVDVYTKSQTYTRQEVDNRFTELIGGAPAALDTLKEIADQLAADESVAASIINDIALERQARQAADGIINNNISTLQTNHAADVRSLDDKIDAEIARATTAETAINTKINNTSNRNATIGFGENKTIATVNGTDITVGVSALPLSIDNSVINIGISGNTLVITKANGQTSTVELPAGYIQILNQLSNAIDALDDRVDNLPTTYANPYALSWSGYNTGNYDGSSTKSFVIPDNTNLLTNGAGYITSTSDISGNAATATKATQDGSGNVITNTYLTKANGITGISVSGAVMTITKGDGTTSTVNLGDLVGLASRVTTLEGLWTDNGTTLTAKSGRSVTGAGFYDSTIS